MLAGVQTSNLIASTLGYFPGDKLGFGGKAARTQIKDWSQQGATGQYRPKGATFDYEKALTQLELPVLAISIDGDDFAPPKAIANLYGKFHPGAPITSIHVDAKAAGQKKLNHFNWVRNARYIVTKTKEWIANISKTVSS